MDFHRVVRKVRQAIAALIAPKPESTALALVPAYIHKGTWLQVTDSGSRIVRSYVYKCRCGQVYEYGTGEANESRMHTCNCGAEFSLLRSIDALDADGKFVVDPGALAVRLSSLAIQRVAKAAQQPRSIPYGDHSVERVEWGGPRDDAREAAFDRGDACLMGPGFGGMKK